MMGGFPRTRPAELVDRTVQPIRVGPLTARPTCPRCSSPHIVPARRAELSDEISALRGGSEPTELATDDFDHWFCSACGQGWPHAHSSETHAAEGPPPLIEPTGAASFLAGLLDVDDLPVVREVRTAPGFMDDPAPPTRRRPRRWKVLALAVVLAGAAVVGVVTFGGLGRDDGARPGTSPTPATSDRHQPASPKGIHAVLRLTQPTWIRAVGDGEVLERSEQRPGHAIIFRGRKVLRLVLGNGGAVELRVNGDRVKTGRIGQQITLTFVRRQGTVVTRTA
jgi:Domain of unknown function (DUF4115)